MAGRKVFWDIEGRLAELSAEGEPRGGSLQRTRMIGMALKPYRKMSRRGR